MAELLLFQFLSVMIPTSISGQQCFSGSYRPMPRGYNIRINWHTRIFPSFSTPTNIECARRCLDEKSCRYWKYSRGKCRIMHSLKDKIFIFKRRKRRKAPETFYQTGADDAWFQVYYVRAGSGFKIYESFVGSGTYWTWGPKSCLEDTCPDFFRASIIDNWSRMPIKMVKVSLFQGNKEMVFLIFNGTRSNIQNWFSHSRIISSPWKDLNASTPNIMMNLKYFGGRRFYAGSSPRSCAMDSGWISVNENAGCPWETNSRYPYIIYSNKANRVKWSQGGQYSAKKLTDIDYADDLSITTNAT